MRGLVKGAVKGLVRRLLVDLLRTLEHVVGIHVLEVVEERALLALECHLRSGLGFAV